MPKIISKVQAHILIDETCHAIGKILVPLMRTGEIVTDTNKGIEQFRSDTLGCDVFELVADINSAMKGAIPQCENESVPHGYCSDTIFVLFKAIVNAKLQEFAKSLAKGQQKQIAALAKQNACGYLDFMGARLSYEKSQPDLLQVLESAAKYIKETTSSQDAQKHSEVAKSLVIQTINAHLKLSHSKSKIADSAGIATYLSAAMACVAEHVAAITQPSQSSGDPKISKKVAKQHLNLLLAISKHLLKYMDTHTSKSATKEMHAAAAYGDAIKAGLTGAVPKLEDIQDEKEEQELTKKGFSLLHGVVSKKQQQFASAKGKQVEQFLSAIVKLFSMATLVDEERTKHHLLFIVKAALEILELWNAAISKFNGCDPGRLGDLCKVVCKLIDELSMAQSFVESRSSSSSVLSRAESASVAPSLLGAAEQQAADSGVEEQSEEEKDEADKIERASVFLPPPPHFNAAMKRLPTVARPFNELQSPDVSPRATPRGPIGSAPALLSSLGSSSSLTSSGSSSLFASGTKAVAGAEQNAAVTAAEVSSTTSSGSVTSDLGI